MTGEGRLWGAADSRPRGIGLLVAGVLLAGVGFAGTFTGTAVASGLVTGRQVENGSVGSVDLRADRGVRGVDVRDGSLSAQKVSSLPQGPAGDQGPAGIPGVDGLDNFAYRITTPPVSVPAGGEGEIVATCDAGTVVVGGGPSSSSYAIRMEENRPLADGSGWKAWVYNESASAVDVYGWAVCVSAP